MKSLDNELIHGKKNHKLLNKSKNEILTCEKQITLSSFIYGEIFPSTHFLTQLLPAAHIFHKKS